MQVIEDYDIISMFVFAFLTVMPSLQAVSELHISASVIFLPLHYMQDFGPSFSRGKRSWNAFTARGQ
jgi:hypothetical protein